MSISSSVARVTEYFKRNGLRATVRRIALATRRALFSSRMVLFYCDLPTLSSPGEDLASFMKVERHRSQPDLSPRDLQEIISFWNPKLAQRNIKERFEHGASLWLIKSEGRLAGFGWSLQGHTVEPHYFRLRADDVHLFDFHVFPQYRGRGVNPLLVSYILRSLTAECQGRAFIEAAEWNQAQLASLQRTPFRYLGSARKFTPFRRAMVFWGSMEAAPQTQDTSDNLRQPVTSRRTSEEKA
jgi:ribosomal protein S18 acetylase RimI-like enzyme